MVNHVAEKAAQKPFGLHSMKPVNHLPKTVSDDGGETLGLVPPGNAHVFIGINLGQYKLPSIVSHQAIKKRLKHPAGAAPIRADVQQHRNLVRTGHNPKVEVSFDDFE